jgi:hypothetical protein
LISTKYKAPSTKLEREALRSSRFLRRVFNCFDDVLVTSATAEIAIQTVTDLFARRGSVPLEQLRRGNDHARRAIAAL